MPADLQIAVLIRARSPLDETDLIIDDFKAGDGVRVNTGAAVEVFAFVRRRGGGTRRNGRAVGVTGNQI